MMNDIWILLTASLVAINAALLGCFLLLRKMALVGDAISHAVLPGIVVAYYFSGDKTSLLLLIGATLTGVVASLMIDFLTKKAKIQGDASIGITYTLLFAVGMILISTWLKGNVDIDMDCVLYGEIGLINLDKIIIDGNLYIGPMAFYTELFAFFCIGLTLVLGFKGFKLLAFNEDYARGLGINTTRWHYVLMTLVSLTTVVSFEVVGAVLVVGFLIIPAATAQLISKKLNRMMFLAAIFGIAAVVIGYALAIWLNVNITGAMVSVSGIIFMMVLIIDKFFRKQQVSKSLNPA
ncbi:metal ABC transporter permease [Crocinitomix catalasitica]|uniref:metal ABC transporter permease n=1 Tax=Crocinitomix catalasitica TaxID=184607 RepID=UPI000A7D0954|nr:metal ABC transporter permease [Crocinitomix catalasitica]